MAHTLKHLKEWMKPQSRHIDIKNFLGASNRVIPAGIGNAHGHFGFKAFSHERGVVRTQVSLASMFFPPYTEKMQKLVKMMIRWS